MSLSIIFIGSGNVATHLAQALHGAGNRIAQVYSRTLKNAKALADKFSAAYTDNIGEIDRTADLYLFSVKDDVLPDIVVQMPRTSGVWVHTAGSVPMDVFAPRGRNYGVLYPLQTFSKERSINFSEIPVCVEGNDSETEKFLRTVASGISGNVNVLPSEKRKYLHLGAVFACNFTNHLYALAAEIVENQQIPFDMLKPLIAETAAKVMEISPQAAQTGPAVRFDETVMRKHTELIGNEKTKNIYSVLSESIYRTAKKMQ